MTKRNSPKDIEVLEDLSDLELKVVDKRNHKRAPEKRNRRDRHYSKQFIKTALKDHLGPAEEEPIDYPCENLK